MRGILYALFFVFVALVSAVVLLPVSFVLDQARTSLPALQYSSAEGSVWNARISGMRYDRQPVGDIRLKTDWLSVFTGALNSQISITEGSVLASGALRLGLDGTASLRDVRVRGNTGNLVSLREEIRDLSGNFALVIRELRLKSGACVAGDGRAETDILTGFEARYGWKGPALTGPLLCRDGRIILELSGTGDSGETINAVLDMDLNANGRFRAEIKNGPENVAQAATLLGFLTLGETLVYEHIVQPGTQGN